MMISTLIIECVVPVRKTRSLVECMIESFNQLHATVQEFLVRNSLLRPSNQHPVQTRPFRMGEFFISQIGVVDHLADGHDLGVGDPKLFYQCFEGAIIPTMAKTFCMEHVKRNGVGLGRWSAAKNKPCLGIDESFDQPGGRDPVNTRPMARYPDAGNIFLGGSRS